MPPQCFTSPATVYSVRLSNGWTFSDPRAISQSTRRIEFVGDSDLAAFGGEGSATEMGIWAMLRMHNSTQNISNSWAHMLSRMLQAEPSVVAWSGIGVAQNAEHCDPPGGKSANMESVYFRAIATDPSSRHSFAAEWQPQLVVVNVGGNDLFGGRPHLRSKSLLMLMFRCFVPSEPPEEMLSLQLWCTLWRRHTTQVRARLMADCTTT